MRYRILVGSYTDRITTLEFDSDAKSLCVHSDTRAGQSPSWIAQHPTNKSLIFATNEVTDGKIQLFRLAEDGSLSFLEGCSSGGENPASLGVSEQAVFVGNYLSGSVLVVPLSPVAPHLQQPQQAPITFEGNGPNKSRQGSSHPHQILFRHNLKTLEEALVPDLGTDKVWRLTKNPEGMWDVAGSIDFLPGTGPRHAVVHDNIIYTALELTNEVASHTLPEIPDKSTLLLSLPSVKEHKPDMLLAEILISPGTPAHPSPLLYVSNRNEGLPAGDTVAIYTPHHQSKPSAELGESSQCKFEHVNSVATGLHHLRGMAIEGKDARYIVAGGTNGGGIKVFERVEADLIEIASTEAVEKPTSFLWV